MAKKNVIQTGNGKARREKLSKEERSRRASEAATRRWAKAKSEVPEKMKAAALAEEARVQAEAERRWHRAEEEDRACREGHRLRHRRSCDQDTRDEHV